MTATRIEVPAPTRYEFGTGTSSGVWLGLSTSRTVLLGLGLLASILALTARIAAPLAALPMLAAASLVAARAGGRPLLDWLTPTAGHAVSMATGSRAWRAPWSTTISRRPPSVDAALVAPPECGRLRLLSCPDDPDLAIVVDRAARTATVVFDVAGVDRFPLLDDADRDALVAGWGSALAILADTDDTLTRLQMIERATHLPDLALFDVPADAATSDRGLTRAVESLAVRRDSRLVVQWAFPRLEDTAVATLAARCRGVSRCLLTARLLSQPLSVDQISRDIAYALRGPNRRGTPINASVEAPGPVSRRSAWTHVRTDDQLHRSFAVTGWPRAQVAADWLKPLLLTAPTGVTRTVAVHLEPVAPATAARIARTTRAKAALDQRDRTRLGMTSSAALERAESSGLAMDAELAAGYRTHRIAALVTLSAPSLDALDDAQTPLRQAAAAARLEIRPLHGQHDRALAATLPLCRLRPRGAA